ncbi:MAG: MBL fold metallo-hydrolase [Xanthomonadales bacterium]|nr:MBL fold metallo-hydrolase [Xanthomonadales bacterium]
MRHWIAAAAIVLAAPVLAQQDFSQVEITTTKVADGIYMLQGSGGNIGVSVGEDGVFMIDDQYAPLTEKILAAVAELSNQPVRFVINTHWHFDHTGGNENLGKEGTVIVAHDNVYQRMSTEQVMERFNRTVPPSPRDALPVVTFTDRVTLRLNGDHAHIIHSPRGHTDGDAFVHFEKANVIHMGDLFFHKMYPFIDLGSGGNANGVIAAVDKALTLADAETQVIPGHGPLTDRDGLQGYRDMLVTIRDRVKEMKSAGKSLEEVVAAKPSAEWDDEIGNGFINPAALAEFFYQSL